MILILTDFVPCKKRRRIPVCFVWFDSLRPSQRRHGSFCVEPELSMRESRKFQRGSNFDYFF